MLETAVNIKALSYNPTQTVISHDLVERGGVDLREEEIN
jgi:hypothetical protein